MDSIAKCFEVYIKSKKFDGGTGECETVLDQLYQAYAETHEFDTNEIQRDFRKLERHPHKDDKSFRAKTA